MTEDDALAEAYERGLDAERRGDRETAAAAYAEALRLDPEDRGGVAVRLAAMGLAEPPDGAPPAYVALLFDQHAERFDHMLVEQLGYHTPMQLRETLDRLGLGPWPRLLDLGCGTGLLGESLRDRVGHAAGVDLSEGMLEMAEEKEAYDALFRGDALAFLAGTEERWDLIAATDVAPYLGDPGPLLAAVAARLTPGGLFAFSTETLPEAAFGGRGWTVGPKHRFAHHPGRLRAALAEAGLETLHEAAAVIRHDEGEPVRGELIVARLRAGG